MKNVSISFSILLEETGLGTTFETQVFLFVILFIPLHDL